MSRTVCGICWCPYDDDTGACACEPELKAQHMTDLRTAAQQALEAYSGGPNWRGFADAMDALRAALAEPVLNPAPGYCKHCKQYTIEEPLPAEPVQQGCDHCNHPLYAAVKCRVCGRAHGAE